MPARRVTSQFIADLKTGSATIELQRSSRITAIHMRSFSANTLAGTWPNVLRLKLRGQDGSYIGRSRNINIADAGEWVFAIGLKTSTEGRWFGVNNGPLIEFDEPLYTKRLTIDASYISVPVATDVENVATATSLWVVFELVHEVD
jgi:hypothetical protein